MKFIKHSKKYLIVSAVFCMLSVLFLVMFGMNFGIDFTGGSVLKFNSSVDFNSAKVRIEDSYQLSNISITSINQLENQIIVKSVEISPDQKDVILADLNQDIGFVSDDIDQENATTQQDFTLDSFETVGAVVGSETIKKSLYAILFALVGIMIYIAYAFKAIPNPYSSLKFGYAALIAMFHDVLITLGVFSLLGTFLGVEIDLLFVTALLTVIGYSVNDSIVVFDRIRENLIKHKKKRSFSDLIDMSINQTLRRSLGTSATVLVVLISLFILGGLSIKYFVLAMIVGVIIGTYSSIFVASPMLYWLEKKTLKPY